MKKLLCLAFPLFFLQNQLLHGQCPAVPDTIVGPSAVNFGVIYQYSTALDTTAQTYTWTPPPGGSINGNPAGQPVTLPAPQGAQVLVQFTMPGTFCVKKDTCPPSCKAIGGFQLIPPCPSNATPPADLCSDACIYCNFNGINSSTAGYTSQTPPGFCGTIENEQWLGFIAGATSATFTAAPTNCTNGDGVQLALYADCQSTPIACDGGCAGCVGTSATVTAPLQIGQTYLLLIDGFAGDQCSFNLSVNPPQAVAAPQLSPAQPIQGPSTICPGGSAEFFVPAQTGAAVVIWNAPAGATINGLVPPVALALFTGGNRVTATFGASGGQVCARQANACYTGQQVCKNIIMQPIPPTTLPPVVVCFEDAPYILPWGDFADVSSLYSHTYASYLGCDSIVRQLITVKPPLVKVLPPKSVCVGGSITVCGQQIDQPGPYSVMCQSVQGCDSIVSGLLQVLDPQAVILNLGTLTCSQTSLTLIAGPSSGIKTWTNASGQIIGMGNQVTVNAPGRYILKVEGSSGALTCSSADTVVVSQNIATPDASAGSGGKLDCSQPNIELAGNSATPNAVFAWSGPNGFSSNLKNPTVDAPGNYILLVTNPANGCTAEDNALIVSDFAQPDASATGGDLDCLIKNISLDGGSTTAGAQFAWSGPDAFFSNFEDPQIGTPGEYLLTVTGPNGCTATALATVNLLTDTLISASVQGQITCLQDSAQLLLVSQLPGSVFLWTGPNGFSSVEQNPMVGAGGTYTVTVLDTQSGNNCTATATVNVPSDLAVPQATVLAQNIDCLHQTGGLNTTFFYPPSAQFDWTGPNGFASDLEELDGLAAGDYSLVLTDPANGCATQEAFSILENLEQPVFAIAQTQVGGCDSPQVVLKTTVFNAPNAYFVWHGPNGFVSTEQNPLLQGPGVGNYTVTVTNLANGCTASKTVNVAIWPVIVDLTASASNYVLTCSEPTAMLIATTTATVPAFAWTFLGSFYSNQRIITVDSPGIYKIKVTDVTSGCSAQQSIHITEDKVIPEISLGIVPVLTCTDTVVRINIDVVPSDLATYAWSGPVWQPTVQNPFVSEPDDYTVTVTLANGCTNTLSVEVLQDTNTPIFTIPGAIQTCTEREVTLQGPSGNWFSMVLWTGPGGFTSNLVNPVVDSAGSYTVVATAINNGCTSSAIAEVVDSCKLATTHPELANLHLSPNPTSGEFSLQNAPPDLTLKIFAASGQMLLQEKTGGANRFSLKNQASGVYFGLLENRGGERLYRFKLVLQRE